MKEIKLDNNIITTIDDEDYDRVSQYKWCYKARGYAIRYGDNVRMHRYILNITDPKIQIDHRNGNKLCNEKWNLRIATTSQNQANRPKLVNGTSKYKGVRRHKQGKWEARITYRYKVIQIGLFVTEDEAALAYNKKATELFGEFAYLNIIGG